GAAGWRLRPGNVREPLLRLPDESLRKGAALVLADHAADERHFAARADAIGEAARSRPALRLQHDVGRRRFGHVRSCYGSSLPGSTRQSIPSQNFFATQMDQPKTGVPDFGRFGGAKSGKPDLLG